MSSYRGNDISITGDGNAVGDNNRLTIIKNERHHHDHRQSSSGGGSSSGDDRPIIFALAFAAISACVVGSYFFALHAQVVYTVLQFVAGAELFAALWLMYVTFDEERTLSPKLVAMALFSILASAGLLAAHIDYRDELTTLAQASKTATQFWCGMNDYGRELALFHAVTAVVGFGLGSLLLALPAGAMSAIRFLWVADDSKGAAVIERLTSWVPIVFGAVLVIGAAYLHTQSGWDFWSNTFGNPPSFFCKPVPSGQ
jgi:hypothetical protein